VILAENLLAVGKRTEDFLVFPRLRRGKTDLNQCHSPTAQMDKRLNYHTFHVVNQDTLVF